jgi:anti-sigma factor RsiW
MTCRQLTSFIADYLSGELDAEIKDSFERHLTLCPNCVQYVADYERAMALGRQVYDDADSPATDVPETLIAAILAARRASC